MPIMLLTSLMPSVLALGIRYPVRNTSALSSLAPFSNTTTIAIQPFLPLSNSVGALPNITLSTVSQPCLAGKVSGIDAVATSSNTTNVTTNATGPACGYNYSDTSIQNSVLSPIYFTSVPYSTDEASGMPTITTIWPAYSSISPEDLSMPPEAYGDTSISSTILPTVNASQSSGGPGGNALPPITATNPPTPISQSNGISIPVNTGSLSIQPSPSAKSGGNHTINSTRIINQTPTKNDSSGHSVQYPYAVHSITIPVVTTPTTTPTDTVKVIPVTD
ncbi:hypothetical protein F4804DRAFT_337298 [Jackrogersella minutella]|nr:hypothetical protein F4804DRAFT_337298 [Jackrogersella minutella]